MSSLEFSILVLFISAISFIFNFVSYLIERKQKIKREIELEEKWEKEHPDCIQLSFDYSWWRGSYLNKRQLKRLKEFEEKCSTC